MLRNSIVYKILTAIFVNTTKKNRQKELFSRKAVANCDNSKQDRIKILLILYYEWLKFAQVYMFMTTPITYL